MLTICPWFTITVSHFFLVWSEHLRWILLSWGSPLLCVGQTPDSMSISNSLRFILTSESPLFCVGETLDFMLSSHDLIRNDATTKVRMIMMMESMFEVRNDEEIKNIKCQYHTHDISSNNGHNQIRLIYNDFIYGANKGKHKAMIIKYLITSLTWK